MTDFYALHPDEQAARLQALAHVALADWDFGPCDLKLLKFRENAVFAAATTSGKRYAVRVHRAGYHSDAELRSELEWMFALQAADFDVPEIVTARNGQPFVRVHHVDVPESRQVDVFQWIEGTQLGSVGDDVSASAAELPRMFHTIGQLAARLHNHGESWVLPQGFTRHAWDAEGLVGEQPFWGRFWDLAALTPDERALVVRARDRLRRDLACDRKISAGVWAHPR